MFVPRKTFSALPYPIAQDCIWDVHVLAQRIRRAEAGVSQTQRGSLTGSRPSPYGERDSINSILPRCLKNYTRMISVAWPGTRGPASGKSRDGSGSGSCLYSRLRAGQLDELRRGPLMFPFQIRPPLPDRDVIPRQQGLGVP